MADNLTEVYGVADLGPDGTARYMGVLIEYHVGPHTCAAVIAGHPAIITRATVNGVHTTPARASRAARAHTLGATLSDTPTQPDPRRAGHDGHKDRPQDPTAET